VLVPVFFAQPTSDPVRLDISPRLASWNIAGHRDQKLLAEALEHADERIRPALASVADPVVLRLDVGLPDAVSWLADHDLDNYLFPLAKHLGRKLVSVWCTKQYAADSFLRVETAAEVAEPHVGWSVRTTASASSTAYKQQIHDQLDKAEELPDGAVSLQIAFVVGPVRNWLNLWKPTIDALGPLLGSTQPDSLWNPRDGRIAELGLHCAVDPDLRNDVVMEIVAAPWPISD
jgi:hypothetical protein